MKIESRQHLIFDADDTLWENNIYFEDAFDDFCDYLAHSSLTAEQIRDRLDDIERENARIHGYGARNFARNLRQCYQALAERSVEDHHLTAVENLAYLILKSPMELLDGVELTLAEIASRHELTIFTKGDNEEQSAKIQRSGLRKYFDHCEIVKEKNREAYVNLAEAKGYDLSRTWMIGNSPKSDINPALDAGMRAVYIPHPRTWTLEREEINDPEGRSVRIQRFPELLALF